MAGLIAFAIVYSVALPWCASQIWLGIRKRSYNEARKRARDSVQQIDPPSHYDDRVLGLTLDLPEETRRKAGSTLRKKIERAAIDAQDRYHAALSYGISALAVAFITLSIAVVWGHDHPEIVIFSSLVDVICFLLSILCFWRGSHWNQVWMVRRSKNELLRQWCVLDNIFLQGNGGKDVETAYSEMEQRFEGEIGQEPVSSWQTLKHIFGAGGHGSSGHGSGLSGRILNAWKKRRSELQSNLAKAPITAAQYTVYFAKRPITQAGWFRYSLARISSYGTWRAVTLQRIFFVTLLVAAFKAWLLLGGPYSLAWLKPWATLAILAMIGLSVAISALYLNQNNRSLSHRYSAQIRSIDDWLERHAGLLSRISTSYDQAVAKALPEGSARPISQNLDSVEFETGRALRLDDETKADLIEQMLTFEDLMAEELLDFLSISEHDALEISAA